MPCFKRTKEQCCHQASPERDVLGLEDRPLVLGKPDTELGCGTQAAGPWGVPSLGKRNISGTSSWHLQQAESKGGRHGLSGLCSAALLRQSNFTKKGTWSASVRQASRPCQLCLHPTAVPGGQEEEEEEAVGGKWQQCSVLAAQGQPQVSPRVSTSPQKGGEKQTGLWWLVSPRNSRRFVGSLSLCLPLPTPAARGLLPVPQGMNPLLLGVCASPMPWDTTLNTDPLPQGCCCGQQRSQKHSSGYTDNINLL